MTKRRPLGNAAMWAFEDTYAFLLEIERELAAVSRLVNGEPALRVAAARLAALKARERIVTVHPDAVRKARR